MSIISIHDLTFTYPGAATATLRNLNLEVAEGDFLAIMGANGCGKSTLCKAMNGLIPQFIVGDMTGSLKVAGLEASETPIGELAQHVGYVYQDFENQLVRPTVLDEASFASLNYAQPDYLERGLAALELCGLADKAQDYVWALSGGQKHLLALAGALALEPEVIILDEPIAQLDPYHARKTYEVLRELNEKHGKTIIVIEHHTDFIAEYCKHAVLMANGAVSWVLPAREALRQLDDLAASDIFPPQIATAARELKDVGVLATDVLLPTTVDEGVQAFAGLGFTSQPRVPRPRSAGEPAVEFDDVHVAYRAVKGEPHTVFDGLDLTIRAGEKVALVGSNGAGKTTLMKLMCGLIKPASGEVRLAGQATRALSPEDISGIISLVYQNPEQMFIKDSVRADVEFAMRARDVEGWQERAQQLIDRFRLTGLADRDGRLMSGGQMRRASLAIGIALDPPVLLLDEPTANLDIATRREIVRTIADLRGITDTVVIATHDMQLVCQFADRMIVLNQGEVIGDGTPEEIFANQAVVEASGICPPEIYAMGAALDPRAACFETEEFLMSFDGYRALALAGAGEDGVGELRAAQGLTAAVPVPREAERSA